MSDQWYFRLLDQEFGPVHLEEIGEMLRMGRLAADDEVRLGTSGPWTAAGTIAESNGTASEPEEIACLSELDFEFVSGHAAPAESRQGGHSDSAAAPRNPSTGTAGVAESVDGWFYRSRNGEVGPVPFEALQDLARQGRLGFRDKIRLGLDGDWMAAGMLGDLRSEMPEPPRPAPAARPVAAKPNAAATAEVSASAPPSAPAVSAGPAADASSRDTAPAAPPVNRPEPAVIAPVPEPSAAETPRPLSGGDTGSFGGGSSPGAFAARNTAAALAAARAKSARPATDREPLLERLKEHLQHVNPQALGALGFGLLIAAAMYLPGLLGGGGGEYYDLALDYYAQFRQLRAQDASPAEWDAFASDARAKLEPVAEELNQIANAQTPGMQNVLFAIREGFFHMLTDARTAPSKNEADFLRYMKLAHRAVGDGHPAPPSADPLPATGAVSAGLLPTGR